MSRADAFEAFVLGRVAVDLYPLQPRTALEDVDTFRRFVGGFGGNVGTGLARLGVKTAVLSGVGDDGHGRYLVKSLAVEQVETRWIVVHPWLRTALAFCELWPPDRFPLTLYRRPTCPDWELRSADLPMDLIRDAPLLYVSGTALAREPSRSAAHEALAARHQHRGRTVATILDLDWRPESWEQPDEYPGEVAAAMKLVDTVIGGTREFEAASLDPGTALDVGVKRVFLKRGPDGATLIQLDQRTDVASIEVDVVNGLGAGDAFAAVVGYGLLKRMDPAIVLRYANAAGAMVTTRLQCAAAMPFRHELEAFVEARA